MAYIQNMTGQRFGRLMVLALVGRKKTRGGIGSSTLTYWTCQCDCGNKVEVSTGALRSNTQSCGCLRAECLSKPRPDRYSKGLFKDLTGMKFGRLTVVERLELPAINQGVPWKCSCDCGNDTTVTERALVTGNTKSCGCLSSDITRKNNAGKKLPYGEAAFNSLYKQYKTRVEAHQLSFDLSRDEFLELTNQNCYYCDREPSNVHLKGTNGPFKYSGIDRIDSELGYIHGNCVPCCKQCNIAKNAYSLKEFISWVSTVHSKLTALGLLT